MGKGIDKEKTISMAINSIEKQFGKGSIMRLAGANQKVEPVPSISTGSLGLDLALGTGGVPRGRTIEIYGPESSGKTTLALHIMAEAQREGGITAFIDAEHALDLLYARRLGVKPADSLVSQPDTGEEALEIADVLIRSGAVDVIVVDSVAALVPRAEINGEMGEPQMGLQARLMSQAMRKLTGSIHRSKTTVIFINQIRMKIGVIERLWRSLKYEEVYLKAYETVAEALRGIGNYFDLYNGERPHQSLGRLTPNEVYAAGFTLPEAA